MAIAQQNPQTEDTYLPNDNGTENRAGIGRGVSSQGFTCGPLRIPVKPYTLAPSSGASSERCRSPAPWPGPAFLCSVGSAVCWGPPVSPRV